MQSAEQSYQSCSTGCHFYSANVTILYWDYDAIASVYKGFTFQELQDMTVRQRDYWASLAKWRSKHT